MVLNPHVFFLYILPPIVFEAGYEMPRAAFLSNIFEILVYAIFGTTMNAFAIGISLWLVHLQGPELKLSEMISQNLNSDYLIRSARLVDQSMILNNLTTSTVTQPSIFPTTTTTINGDVSKINETSFPLYSNSETEQPINPNIYQNYEVDVFSFWGELPGSKDLYSLSVFLLFGAIISAVDPVAVIAVFDEIHVNVTLYILVFGESLLNDGVAIVLYQVFEKFSSLGDENITGLIIFKGFLTFLVVAFGGTFIGLVIGYSVAFFSKYTHIMQNLEPVVVLFFSYMAYLIADMLEMSGILAIVMAGFTT